jgi:hypothetical protein
MMCDLLLSQDGPYDLGAVKKKGIITPLAFHVCLDDKKAYKLYHGLVDKLPLKKELTFDFVLLFIFETPCLS